MLSMIGIAKNRPGCLMLCIFPNLSTTMRSPCCKMTSGKKQNALLRRGLIAVQTEMKKNQIISPFNLFCVSLPSQIVFF